jgi:hypothetical protein
MEVSIYNLEYIILGLKVAAELSTLSVRYLHLSSIAVLHCNEMLEPGLYKVIRMVAYIGYPIFWYGYHVRTV